MATQRSDRAALHAGETSMYWPLGYRRPANQGRGTSGLAAVLGVGDLRATNAAAVLHAIRSAPRPQRHSELAAVTKLSRPTVEAIVEELAAQRLVTATPGVSPSGVVSPGRPAKLFAFNPAAAFVVGVDVRAYAVNACVANLDGDIVQVVRRRVRRDLTGLARVKLVVETVLTVLEESAVPVEGVRAATLATPGWVEDNQRVRYVDNLKDWAQVDVAGDLAAALGCPVAIDNDANLAAVGEQWRGVSALANDVVFILAGERVGAGIISGGRPLHGHHGAAGEIGFMVFPDGQRLPARSIGEDGAQRPGLDPTSIYSDAAIVRDAVAGNRLAVLALESVGERLAQALAPMLLALDPELVVLGTSLFEVLDVAATEIVLRAAERHAATMLVDPPRWALSSLREDAVLTGAVRFALAALDHKLDHRPLSLFG